MPTVSRSFRRLAGMAEHHPEKVNPENKGILKMTQSQLHDFASTPEKGLPEHVKRGRRYYGESR